MAARPPLVQHQHQHHLGGPGPSPSPIVEPASISSSKSPIDFSPPLIAMVVVAAAAFIFIAYSRFISRHLFPPFLRLLRRRRFLPSSDFGSPPSHPSYQYSDVYSPHGLDESVIKNIPLTVYNLAKGNKQQEEEEVVGYIDELDGYHDCAVCLVDFQEGDYIRTLPHCCHPFHVDCIDMWLRSHATCPLCRSGVFFSSDSPLLSPLMAARIRPSFDHSIFLESLPPQLPPPSPDIQELFSPVLNRSYSFGFERTSPSLHRYRRSFFCTKRPSSTPFRSLSKSRVFSFRRSPAFFRRRGFLPMSESSTRMKASPLMFSSSRMRLGDPEALISPDRYNRRHYNCNR